MRKLTVPIMSAMLALAVSAGVAFAGNGPPAVSFYVDDVLYRTVATPNDLSGTGAPAHSFDTIYALGNDADGNPLMNVADAAPGDRDYNGGRWMVLAIIWLSAPTQLTSEEQVLEYESLGLLSIGDDPVAQFTCPVIKVQGNR